MKAKPIEKSLTRLSADAFYEVVIWHLPSPVPGSNHHFKYRMALVIDGECVLRYDNERGKGDHKHVGNHEETFTFTTLAALYAAFHADMKRILE